MPQKYSLISSFLLEFAREENIELDIEPVFGYAGRITTKSGKYAYYHSTRFDINYFGASEIAKDKGYASYFMKKLGYTTPNGEAFYSDKWCMTIKSDKNVDAACQFARSIGFPVIVKPNSESQGRGVQKVSTELALRKAIAVIFDDLKDQIALVQEVVKGNDYRIIVLGDEVLCAYKRYPLHVIGDGKNSIEQLLQLKQQEFIGRGRDTVINLADPRIMDALEQLDLQKETILAKDQKISLLANANLSSGGESEDVTSFVQEDYKKLAVQLTKDMGLIFCGIDMMIESPIDEPVGTYCILEINAAPGLDYYAESGTKQHEIVKALYRKLFRYIINDYSVK